MLRSTMASASSSCLPLSEASSLSRLLMSLSEERRAAGSFTGGSLQKILGNRAGLAKELTLRLQGWAPARTVSGPSSDRELIPVQNRTPILFEVSMELPSVEARGRSRGAGEDGAEVTNTAPSPSAGKVRASDSRWKALRSGPRGRWFESSRPDHFSQVRTSHIGHSSILISEALAGRPASRRIPLVRGVVRSKSPSSSARVTAQTPSRASIRTAEPREPRL
jgi:hypothetical protein